MVIEPIGASGAGGTGGSATDAGDLRAVFDHIDEGFCICEMILDADGAPVDYRFLEVNHLFEAMTGLVDATGRTALELVPDLERRWIDTYGTVALDRQTLRFQQGSEAMARWFDVFATPLEAPRRFAIVFRDDTARRGAELALVEASAFLRRVLDSLFTFVGVLRPDGTLTEANRAPLEAAGLTLDDVIGKKFWDCHWWNHDPDVQRRLEDAVHRAAGGETVRYDERIRVADAGFMEIDFQLVPLADEQGTITHLIPSGLDITERSEVERARRELTRWEQRRRTRAELLQENASRLAAASTPVEIARAVLGHLETALGLELAAVNLARGESVEIEATQEVRPAPAAGTTFLVASDLPGPRAIATNQAIRLRSADAILEHYPVLRSSVEHYELESVVALPIRTADGDAVGALVVGAHDPDTLDDDTLTVLAEIADQTGLALQRAFLHERLVESHRREHEIAVRLQKALLPDRLVEDPRLAVAARYEAADAHLEVGGDWYDTHQWPDGRISILVGDVVGHDLEAAAAMGRLRSATAALMRTAIADPVTLLEALEHVALGPGGTDFVTAACVVIDPADGSLTYATAGHPPPLLITAQGTRWLDGATSPPMGVVPIEMRPAGTVSLAPGDVVVLYTDGLVERRGRSIDVGLSTLASAGRRHAVDDVTELVDRLIADLTADGFGDDVVVVAARWNP